MINRYPIRSKYQKRRRRRQPRLRFVLCLVVFLAVLTGGILFISNRVRLTRDVAPYQETFSPGVTINGVELTGYGYEEARQLLEERYASSLHEPITLTFGEKIWKLTPAEVGAQIDLESQIRLAWNYGKNGTDREKQAEIHALKENPVELSAELTYDEAALAEFVSRIKAEIDCSPVNATRRILDNEQFVFTDSSEGYRLDAEQLHEQLTEIILNGGDREVELQPEVILPSPSRAELEAATVLLAECSTSLDGSSTARNNNVNLALGYFNYLEVQPGEKISFNRIVGKRTEKNGFTAAPEFAGTTVVTGIGGGTCQASTTVYGAVIRAGLKILERHPHTMTVGYVKASQDAAVNDNDKDLRFQNNTESTLIFFAWIDVGRKMATVKIYGKPIDSSQRIEIVSQITQTDIRGGDISYKEDLNGDRVWYKDDPPVLAEQGKPGMRSEAYRVYYSLTTGEEISREKLSSDYYAPQNDIYLVGVHERE